ncbi:hypothetical protein Hanom_Chr06g00509151 [Helianthus anomalus]
MNDMPKASAATKPNTLHPAYFFYVLRFSLISLQRACVIQIFYPTFRSALFLSFLFILFLRAFPMLVITDSGIALVRVDTVL